MLTIRLDQLKNSPREVVFDHSAEEFPPLAELQEGNGLIFTAPVVGRLRACRVNDVVEVVGDVETAVRMPCSRCLEEVDCDCHLDLRLCYRPDTSVESAEDAELELDEEDVGLIRVTGEEIDLKADLAQEIIMALPQQPLCRSNCAGLCPVCGVNLNHSTCDCERPVFHTGLAALKDLKIDK